jgi:hypothetical protein
MTRLDGHEAERQEQSAKEKTMYPEKEVRQPSILGLLSTILVFMVVIVYAVVAFSTRDVLWFWPKFENQPTSIVVHCYGQDVEITSASQDLDPLAKLINRALSGEKRWDLLSLSEVTYEEYRTSPRMLSMEVYYPESVRVHTDTAFFSNVDVLVIPLDARHSNYNTLFGRTQAGEQTAGSLHVESLDDLRVYLLSHGICHPTSALQQNPPPALGE